jgi:general stress protein 26
MHTPEELEKKFWNALKADRTVMLGLSGVDGGHTRPMTAQFEDERGPVWFFTSTDNALVPHSRVKSAAIVAFSSKNHDLFCSAHGTLVVDNDPAVIDRLWNTFVAAWYEGGKTDPKLTLLRLDLAQAEIWLNASSILAGIKVMLGIDPKIEYQDNVAKVQLG